MNKDFIKSKNDLRIRFKFRQLFNYCLCFFLPIEIINFFQYVIIFLDYLINTHNRSSSFLFFTSFLQELLSTTFLYSFIYNHRKRSSEKSKKAFHHLPPPYSCTSYRPHGNDSHNWLCQSVIYISISISRLAGWISCNSYIKRSIINCIDGIWTTV